MTILTTECKPKDSTIYETFFRSEYALKVIADNLHIPRIYTANLEDLKRRVDNVIPILIRDSLPTFMYIECHSKIEDQSLIIEAYDSIRHIGTITVNLES